MALVEIVCLANSRKLRGRCIAGLRSDGAGWVRPVGPGDGALYSRDYTLNDGSEARVCDLLRIELGDPCPRPHQPENWFVGQRKWELVHRPDTLAFYMDLLQAHVVSGPDLFGNEGDRVDYTSLQQCPAQSSLAVVVAESLTLYKTTSFRGKDQIRALFTLGACRYDLAVTDPCWESRLAQVRLGASRDIARSVITVSLGEPLEGYCYKLAAAVIPLRP